MKYFSEGIESDLLRQKIANMRADITMGKPIPPEDVSELLALVETLPDEIDSAYESGYEDATDEADVLSSDEEQEYDRGYEAGYADGKSDAETETAQLD